MAQPLRIQTEAKRPGDTASDLYQKRAEGDTLHESRSYVEGDTLHESRSYVEGGSLQYAHHAHERCVVLAAYFDADEGELGYIQVASFTGGHMGAAPHTDDYRGDITVQIISANGEPTRMHFTWEASKALCAAIEAWEQEHPDVLPLPPGVPDFSEN